MPLLLMADYFLHALMQYAPCFLGHLVYSFHRCAYPCDWLHQDVCCQYVLTPFSYLQYYYNFVAGVTICGVAFLLRIIATPRDINITNS